MFLKKIVSLNFLDHTIDKEASSQNNSLLYVEKYEAAGIDIKFVSKVRLFKPSNKRSRVLRPRSESHLMDSMIGGSFVTNG